MGCDNVHRWCSVLFRHFHKLLFCLRGRWLKNNRWSQENFSKLLMRVVLYWYNINLSLQLNLRIFNSIWHQRSSKNYQNSKNWKDTTIDKVITNSQDIKRTKQALEICSRLVEGQYRFLETLFIYNGFSFACAHFFVLVGCASSTRRIWF